MKHVRLSLVLIIMLGLIAGGFIMLDKKEAAGNQKTDRQPTAYIEGNESNVSFKLDGRIEELLVNEGDLVKKGEVLGYLQNDELKAKVLQAKAAIGVTDGQISEAIGAQSAEQPKKNKAKLL